MPPKPQRPVPGNLPLDLDTIASVAIKPVFDLSHLQDPSGIKRVRGRLPGEASIVELGLSAGATALLTPSASQLTKDDLTELNEDPAGTIARLRLTVDDVNSIRTAFSTPLFLGGIGGNVRAGFGVSSLSVSCCCCTPCCCAVAAIEPIDKIVW